MKMKDIDLIFFPPKLSYIIIGYFSDPLGWSLYDFVYVQTFQYHVLKTDI